jgi:signal transduction histidine kinase
MWNRVRPLLEPMNLAGYVAWAAIGSELWSHAPESTGLLPDAWTSPALVAGHALFLALFLARALGIGDRPGLRVLVAAQVVVGLAMIAPVRSGAVPILLIVAMAQAAHLFTARTLAIAFVAVNGALYAILAYLWRIEGAAIWLATYASFEAFAMLTAWYAARAERSRDELAQVNADLIATRTLLAESARDSERLRLARELHDVAGHKLTALKLNLAALAREPRLADCEPVALCARLADELLADIRGVVQQMRLHDGVDLRSAVQALVAPFPSPRVHLALDEDARVVDVAQAEAVLRTVQEGLTNAARHSGAAHVWVELRRAPAGIALDIRDDGHGGGAFVAGNGLAGMRERLEALGGSLQIGRGAEGGVRLSAQLPADAA